MLSRLSTSTSFGVVLFSAALLLGSALFTGCADGVFSAEDPSETQRPGDDAKFRQAHLLQRALRATPGKSASAGDLGLIVALQHGVDKQKIVDRYKIASRFRVANRYKVANRYEYDYVFEGFAWTIEDSLGLSDYQEFLDSLTIDPDILWFEPDFDVNAPAPTAVPNGSGQEVPWSVAAVGGETSWTVSGDGQGSVNVDVYILDTGISNSDVNVVESVDFREGFNDAADHDGHGTHVAGIAAADDDTDGLVGLAPGARIHNYKVLGDDGRGDISQVIAAIEQLTTAKLASPSTPMVVNLSLGEDIGVGAHSALDDAVEASVAAGVVFVVAAGNQGKNASGITPAKVESAITVGAYVFDGSFASFSNYGPKVDLLAPGEGIVSLSPGSSPVEMTGTSMAAAHVTGAVALYLGQNPTATPAQVRAALLASAQDFVTGAPTGTTTKSVWVGGEGSSNTVLLVTPNAGNLTAQDAAKKTLMESFGFTVNTISASASQASYNAAVADADVAYISEEVSSSDVGTKLTGAAIGVINEESALFDELQLATGTTHPYEATITITDGTHYITDTFGSGSLTIFSSSQPANAVSGTLASGLQTLALYGSDKGLVVLDAGASTLDGPAAGRRVKLPWGGNDFDINSLTADGQMLVRRALEWAGGNGGGNSGGSSPTTFETRVSSGNDDAEEEVSNGDMSLDSSDLELISDGGDAQLVGMRFTGVSIPQGATITNAYIQFTVDETNSGTTNLTIRGQDTDDAASFSSSDDNISDRATTSASKAWAPPAWNTVGEAGPNQRTPDLSAIVQEIVDRGGWSSGNDLVLIVTGTGERTAESYNGSSSKAPLLHVEYQQ